MQNSFIEEDVIRSHEVNFLNKFGALYELVNHLVTNKININNAYIDQIHLVSNLMRWYDKDNLFARMKISVIKSKSLENEFLKKAQIIFYDSKNNPTKGVKSFFPKEF